MKYPLFSQSAANELFVPKECPWKALDALLSYLKSVEHKGFSDLENVVVTEPEFVSIGENTKISPFVQIDGPCIFGKNCFVGPGALIRGGCVFGDNCYIGHGVEVKHSLVSSGVTLAHFNYVGDSILNENVHLAAGAVIANQRQDKKEIFVTWQEERVNTKRTKLGAIIGRDVAIGCNCVVNPGTVISSGAIVRPLRSVSGVI